MSLKRWLIFNLFALIAYASYLQAVVQDNTTLVGRAILPATTFADGPTSGSQIGKVAINGISVPFVNQQPVQGFSAVLANADGSFLVMSDNGFGTMENSADYHLRVYTIRPDFKMKDGGTGRIEVDGFVELSDPNSLIPFIITHEFTSKRVLTGADFDIESFQKAPDGSFWFGDEFGPFLLHTDAQGVVLEPPIPLPDFDNSGKKIRSPQNPFNEEASTVRVLNALAHHAQLHGNTKMPALSPDYRLIKGSFKKKHENRGYGYDKKWIGLKAAASSIFDIQSIQKAGYRVIPWTVNDKSDMLALMALGINGIISDRPDLLLKAVREFDANSNGIPGDLLTINGLIDINQFDAQGHRGGRNLRPENTLPAMEVGLDYLMTTLETDINITKDGIPILKHDPYIRHKHCRRTNGLAYIPEDEVLIKDLTLAQIQSTFICDKNPGRGETQKNEHDLSPVTMSFIQTNNLKHPYTIPTLQQLFDFVNFYIYYYKYGAGENCQDATQRWQNAEQVRFNIETKINPRSDKDKRGSVYKEQTVDFKIMADTLAQTIIDNQMAERATIQSFDFRTNKHVQEHFPTIHTSYLIGDFPKVSADDYAEHGDNLQDENSKNTPWLAGLYWPYRVTVLEQNFRAKTSGGFEGMAITPDGKKLITLLEKPIKKRCCSSVKKGILLMHEFDIATQKYTGVRYQYQLSARGTSIADFVLFTQNQGLVIERDDSQGDMQGFKMIYKVTLKANGEIVEKSPLVNLLKIADPDGISQGISGDIGIGKTFGLPFVTIEGIVILNNKQIGVLNDNNYPFSVGRHVGRGLPDDNEFIIIELEEALW